MKRIIFLLLTLSFFLIAGCGSPSVTASSSLLTANLSDYTIVYPAGDVSSELRAEIWGLQKTIQKKFGVRLTVALDRLEEGQTPASREILIGRTNRAESRTAFASAPRLRDTAIRIVDEKLAIAASTEENLIALLKKAAAAIEALPDGTAYFFNNEMEFAETGEYDTPLLQIGDTDLSAYTLVVAEEDVDTTLAQNVQSLLKETYQYSLPAVSDAYYPVPTHAIFVGKTRFGLPEGVAIPAEGTAVSLGSEEDLYIYAEDTPSLREAILSLFSADAEPSAGVRKIPTEVSTVTTDVSLMTTMSYNVFYRDVTETRGEHVVERIRLVQPDTLGVQEATPEWIEILSKALDEYGYVGIGREADGSGEHSGIFYNKNRFRLLESGTRWMSDTPEVPSKFEESGYIRIFTYALLERIEDGKQFLHFNTHADFKTVNVAKKQYTVLMEFAKEHFPEMPMILTGDLNQVETSFAIQYLLNEGMENGAHLALKGSNEYTTEGKVVDYCLVSKGDFAVYEYGVDTISYGPNDPSDHRPVYIRYHLH